LRFGCHPGSIIQVGNPFPTTFESVQYGQNLEYNTQVTQTKYFHLFEKDANARNADALRGQWLVEPIVNPVDSTVQGMWWKPAWEFRLAFYNTRAVVKAAAQPDTTGARELEFAARPLPIQDDCMCSLSSFCRLASSRGTDSPSFFSALSFSAIWTVEFASA
jgi:hypothetical protein